MQVKEPHVPVVWILRFKLDLLAIYFLWGKIIFIDVFFYVCVDDSLELCLVFNISGNTEPLVYILLVNTGSSFSHRFLMVVALFPLVELIESCFQSWNGLGNDLTQLLHFCRGEWGCDLFKLWTELSSSWCSFRCFSCSSIFLPK